LERVLLSVSPESFPFPLDINHIMELRLFSVSSKINFYAFFIWGDVSVSNLITKWVTWVSTPFLLPFSQPSLQLQFPPSFPFVLRASLLLFRERENWLGNFLSNNGRRTEPNFRRLISSSKIPYRVCVDSLLPWTKRQRTFSAGNWVGMETFILTPSLPSPAPPGEATGDKDFSLLQRVTISLSLLTFPLSFIVRRGREACVVEFDSFMIAQGSEMDERRLDPVWT